MNILVTLNSGYVLPLCTMLKSLSYSNEGTDIDLYIVHSSLTLADFQKINAVTINTDISLHPIKVDNSLFDGAPTCKRISKETYYRIFASELLPEKLDRILYIDPDTVVINRLDDFYNADFGSNVLIGAKHFDGYIGLYDEYVINLDERCFARLLNKESFEKAKKYVDEHTDIIHFNGKFKPWKSDYKGELDGYWHHFDRMPSYKARRYYSETA